MGGTGTGVGSAGRAGTCTGGSWTGGNATGGRPGSGSCGKPGTCTGSAGATCSTTLPTVSPTFGATFCTVPVATVPVATVPFVTVPLAPAGTGPAWGTWMVPWPAGVSAAGPAPVACGDGATEVRPTGVDFETVFRLAGDDEAAVRAFEAAA